MAKVVFVLIAALLLLALVQTPVWALYALVGVVVGAGVRGTIRNFIASARFRRYSLAGLGVACLLIIVIAVSIPNLMESRGDRAMPRKIIASYSADVSLDEANDEWQIRDRLQLTVRHEYAYDEMSGPDDFEEASLEVDAELTEQMQNAGWTLDADAPDELTFVRTRTEWLTRNWMAPHTANDLEIPQIEWTLDNIRLTPASEGHLTIDVPKNFVSRTEPKTEYRDESNGDRENLAVSFNYRALPENDTARYVRVEVMHPMFQNKLVIALRRIGDLPFVHWAIMGICGTFHQRLHKRLIEPWSSRLVRKIESKLPRRASKQPITNVEPEQTGPPDLEQPPPSTLPIDAARYDRLFSSLQSRDEDSRDRNAGAKRDAA